jgi:hypothetical protein
VPIEEQVPIARNEQILAAAEKLRRSDALLSSEKVASQLTAPVGGKVDLVEPQNRPLTGRDVAKRAREAYTRIGWYYLCTKCDKWHLDFSGGYAIAPDALVTCHHCLSPRPDMREAFLIALNRQNEVLPITGSNREQRAAGLRDFAGRKAAVSLRSPCVMTSRPATA